MGMQSPYIKIVVMVWNSLVVDGVIRRICLNVRTLYKIWQEKTNSSYEHQGFNTNEKELKLYKLKN
jgi:hypothetical protein